MRASRNNVFAVRKRPIPLSVALSMLICGLLFVNMRQQIMQTDELTTPGLLILINGTDEVPHILHFVDTRYNILKTRRPLHFYQNIRSTIQLYKEKWAADPQVFFWTNEDCLRLISKANAADLLPHYGAERHGPNKSDICRLAALHLYGGYYFDNDMRVAEVWNMDSTECNFASAWCPNSDSALAGNIMNTFIAVAPGHGLIPLVFAKMLKEYKSSTENSYRGRGQQVPLLGPRTMAMAYREFYSRDNQHPKECMLQEGELENLHSHNMFTNIPLQNGTGWGCNYVLYQSQFSPPVHKALQTTTSSSDHVYFFSRMVGTRQDTCGFPPRQHPGLG